MLDPPQGFSLASYAVVLADARPAAELALAPTSLMRLCSQMLAPPHALHLLLSRLGSHSHRLACSRF